MSEKRMAGDYEILQALSIGRREIVIGENPLADLDSRYMCAFCVSDALFDSYNDVMVSDNYMEILQLFNNRVATATQELSRESEKSAALDEGLPVQRGYKLLSADDDLRGKVVVLKPETLKKEYQTAVHQYQLVTGGFGASPNSRGNACYCISLYGGENSRYERYQILGIAEELPHWAEKALEQVRTEQKKDKGAR